MPPPLEHIYLSPHLDDAVFSCGGAMAAQRARGERVSVVTVCAGLPDDGAPAPLLLRDGLRVAGFDARRFMELRRDEDRRALSLLDVEYEWADGLDAIYRLPQSYETFADLVGPIAADDPLVDLAVKLARGIPPGSLLYAPLGAGEHVDHRIVHDAASQLGRRVLFYEDFPYAAHDPEAVPRRLRVLGGAMDPVVTDISTTLERRVAATLCYPSQTGPPDAMAALVAAHARRIGEGVPHERLFARPDAKFR